MINNLVTSQAQREFQCYRVNIDEEHNIRSLHGNTCKAGKWNIPATDYERFLESVCKDIERPGCNMHLLENPNKEYNQIKFDIDMRFTASDSDVSNTTKIISRCDDDFIQTVVRVINHHLLDLIEINTEYYIYVQNKKEPRITGKIIKEGLHIIIPEIVLHNEVLHSLRNAIVADDEIIELFDSVNNTIPADQSIDKVIIDTNAWFIYGCGKPGDDVYKVYNIFKIINKNSRSKIEKLANSDSHYKNKLIDYIKLFSNFGKVLTTEKFPYLDSVDIDVIRSNVSGSVVNASATISKTQRLEYLKVLVNDRTKMRSTCELTEEEIKSYLKCIKEERIDDFHMWRRVGLSLYNMDSKEYMLKIWNWWSKKSSKYNESENYRIWCTEFPTMDKYKLGLHTIKDIACIDNPEMYKQVHMSQRKQFFENWIALHLREAKYIKSGVADDTFAKNVRKFILDYSDIKMVCANPDGEGTWYKFLNHKWSVDRSASRIHLILTNTIRGDLMGMYEYYEAEHYRSQRVGGVSQISSEGEDEDDEIPDDLKFKKDVNNGLSPFRLNQDKCGQLLEYLSKAANKSKIVGQLSITCYEGFEDFEKNLNENKNVFVCKNGVLDLEHCVFRKGEPSDLSTISCNIEYPLSLNDEDVDNMIELQDYLDRIFPDEELQNYFLNKIAEKLSGVQLREEFHICTGSGANGKSQIFKLIACIFGEYYHTFDPILLCSTPNNANGPSPAVAGLKAVRIAASGEPTAGKPFETDRLKLLISGDNLTGRMLNKDPITFNPQYSMFLMCNDIPEMPATDDGVWRKIFILLFESKFISKEEDMFKLLPENRAKYPNHFKGVKQEDKYAIWAPYLLRMLFERYKLLKENNFKYHIPLKVLQATRKYQAESNIFTQFHSDKITDAPGYKILVQDAFAEFKRYVEEVGCSIKFTKQSFQQQMDRVIGTRKGKYYHDIKVNDIGEDAGASSSA